MTKNELKLLQNFNKGLTALIERNKMDLTRLNDKQRIYVNGKLYAYDYIQHLFTSVMLELQIRTNKYDYHK